MPIVYDYSIHSDPYQKIVSVYLKDGNRNGTFSLYRNNQDMLDNFFEAYYNSSGSKEEMLPVLQEIVNRLDVSLSNRPKIEDASPALQYIYQEILDADGECYFVPTAEDDSYIFDRLGLTEEEFERQVTEDIAKYDLDLGLMPGDPENYELFMAFPVLRDAFSQADPALDKSLKDPKKKKDSSFSR